MNLRDNCESTNVKTTQKEKTAAENAVFPNFLAFFCVVSVTVLYSVGVKTAKKRKSHVGSGVTVKKSEDFSEWYVEVILKAGLADYAPVKGCMIIREDAYAIWEKIQETFNQRIKASGHRNVYFPMFIPESLLKKEAAHFAGFTPEVAWISQGGTASLRRG